MISAKKNKQDAQDLLTSGSVLSIIVRAVGGWSQSSSMSSVVSRRHNGEKSRR